MNETVIYPNGPVRILVGVPIGGPLDIAVRLISPWLAEKLDCSCVVENLVGDHSNIAAREVLHAAPDGHALLLSGPVYPINDALLPDVDFDFQRDFVPVASLFRVPLVVEVNLSVPINSVPELIAYAKRNPGTLKLAYAGIGTPQHIGIEVFKAMTGLEFELVSYPGSAPALADLLGGKAVLLFDQLPSSAELVRSGKLRPLAVTSPTPSGALPGVPAMSDFVPGYEAGSWFGINARKDVSPSVIEVLNSAINASLSEAMVQSTISLLSGRVMAGTSNAFGDFIAAETEKYRRVVRSTNIQVR